MMEGKDMNEDARKRRGTAEETDADGMDDAERSKPERFPRIYTVRDVARILRIDIGTVYRKLRLGKLPEPLPYSKSFRWNGAQFDRWVGKGCPEPKKAGSEKAKRNGKKTSRRRSETE